MIKELTALTLTILVSSTVGLTTLNFNPSDQTQVNEYVSIIDEVGDGYQHTVDDLCGMMEIAQKFRDDPDYHYDPADMEQIIMRDGINGTQELIDAYNELLNATIPETEPDNKR
jgi:hypothetical protein